MHHVVLVAIAFTFRQLERARAPDARPTLPLVRSWIRQIMGLLYLLHTRQLLRTLDTFRSDPPLRR